MTTINVHLHFGPAEPAFTEPSMDTDLTPWQQVERAACDLLSEHGENPEYDRALVEVCADLGITITPNTPDARHGDGYIQVDTTGWLPGVYPPGYGARRVGRCEAEGHNPSHFEDRDSCLHWTPLAPEEAGSGYHVVRAPRAGSLRADISVDTDENISVHHSLQDCIWWDHSTQGWARGGCAGRMTSVTVGTMHTHGNPQTVLVCESHLNAPGNPYHH